MARGFIRDRKAEEEPRSLERRPSWPDSVVDIVVAPIVAGTLVAAIQRSSGTDGVVGCAALVVIDVTSARCETGAVGVVIIDDRDGTIRAVGGSTSTVDGVGDTPTSGAIAEQPKRAGGVAIAGRKSMVRIRVRNRTRYVDSDLRRFFGRGARAMHLRGTFQIDVVPSPIRSRGCAEVGGRRMVIAIASPSNFSLRRLARLFEHEVAHWKGLEHEQMKEGLLYSLGPTPAWAKGFSFRYRKRSK